MRIRFFEPHPLLQPHVSQIWIVENHTGWRREDIKTIVPNGRMKIVFPYRAALLNRAVLPTSPHRALIYRGVSDSSGGNPPPAMKN